MLLQSAGKISCANSRHLSPAIGLVFRLLKETDWVCIELGFLDIDKMASYRPPLVSKGFWRNPRPPQREFRKHSQFCEHTFRTLLTKPQSS